MAGCECEFEARNQQERKTLLILLIINAVMFVVELIAGVAGDSTALIADSADMLADAGVYGIGLYAIGKSVLIKAHAALVSGVFLVVLAASILLDVVWRSYFGSAPESLLMIVVGSAALVANVTCLLLINKHKGGEVHMRASWIFSKNDVIANVGVIIGGLLVAWLHSPYPDLIIASVVLRGGIHIIADSQRTKHDYLSQAG